MMSPEIAELAKKLVVREDWEWAPGMQPCVAGKPVEPAYRCALTCYEGDEDVRRYMGIAYAGAFPAWGWPAKGSGWIPNLLDAATGGVLLTRVKFGPDDQLYRVGRGWRICRAGGGILAGMTLGEVAAKAILLEEP